jgi:hypothetical protein
MAGRVAGKVAFITGADIIAVDILEDYDESRYVTGLEMRVDAGATIR